MLKGIIALMGLFVTLPIWYFLLYRILAAVDATELMWFLYWVYVPASMLIAMIQRLIEE